MISFDFNQLFSVQSIKVHSGKRGVPLEFNLRPIWTYRINWHTQVSKYSY